MSSKINNIKHYAIRNLRVHNTQSFQFYLKFLRMFQDRSRTYNLYYSMAVFKDGVPYRNTKGGNLIEDFEDWNGRAKKEIISFDMPIDIDAGDFSEMDYAVESAENIKMIFDTHNVPYYLRFSGQGFHFVIPHRFMPDNYSLNPSDENSIYPFMKKIAVYLHDEASEMVDTGIYDSRRVLKIPYSLSIYPEGSFVCCPIKDLRGFDYRDYEIKKFKNNSNNYESETLHNSQGNIDFFKDG